MNNKSKLILLLLIATLGGYLYLQNTDTTDAPSQPAQTQESQENQGEQASYDSAWKLEDLYQSDEAWESELASVSSSIDKFSEYENTFTTSLENFIVVFDEMERLYEKADKLYGYANLKKDDDTSNEKYLDMLDRAEGEFNRLGEVASFIEPAIIGMKESTVRNYMKDERLKDYDFYLDDLLKNREDALSKEEERIIALAQELNGVPKDVYESFQYQTENPYPEDYNYENIFSDDREKRKKEIAKFYQKQKNGINMLATALSSEVKFNIFNAKANGYDKAIEKTLDEDGITLDEYNAMIEVVNENLPLLHRYVSLKKDILGIEDYRYYDAHMPLFDQMDEYIEYPTALEIVKDGLKPLGEDYIKDLQAAFDDNWVNYEYHEGKYEGAYAMNIHSVHPYVLLNYNGSVDSVSTIAHEMGHALNYKYTNEAQPFMKSNIPIFTAEVASTTNEVMLLEHMIKNAQTKEQKLTALQNYIELISGTLYTQMMFAEFEQTIHDAGEQNQTIDASYLNETWNNLSQKYYGKDYVVEEEDSMGWSNIPHFYENFYVYKYASGISAGISFADTILKAESEEEKAPYFEFLRAGSSDYPVEVLAKSGVNMHNTEAFEKAFEKFEWLLDEFEAELKSEN